ncbi:transposase [Saccharothrix sp. NPDC042600]|uniref:IS701 family transposase n=1 Tax=Saccharothrix sp. NPDC042600 TaxID=3154492 RepID=UPI0033DDCFBA|nr:transposase [Saccharothrix mutabilis subsp. capreolus]
MAARTAPDLLLDPVVAELSSTLFASFAREDQRRKGVEYLDGLLRARGRKSIRNIAQAVGGQATEQYLHHFISDSTWGWAPVRRALAAHVGRVAPPAAWVVRPMLIPKAGKHSVGVTRRFCPDLGQTLNAQQAMGVWAVSDELAVPVDWRLHLSQAWVADPGRRSRAAIPDGVRAETDGECAVEAFLGADARLAFPDRPLVMDARGTDVHAAVARLHPETPLLMRISGTQLFTVLDPGSPRRGADPLPAQQVVGLLREARKPVAGRWPLLAATVRVGVPGGRAGDLVLLGVGPAGKSWPAELWLSNQPDADAASLLRTSRFLDRVDHDFGRFADRVGMRDFTGRSFAGWHRHTTLASAAHAVLALVELDARDSWLDELSTIDSARRYRIPCTASTRR